MIPARALYIEDNDDDFLLVTAELRRSGLDLTTVRVQDEEGLRSALHEQEWDLILSDYRLPRFSGLAALGIVRSAGIDVPFIVVSSTIGEQLAVELMRRGATDYVMKDNLSRLGPAVRRELVELADRRQRRRADGELRHLQERFEATFENAAVGIAQLNVAGEFQLVNDRLCQILGYSRGELLESACAVLAHPESQHGLEEGLARMARGELNVVQVEDRCIRKDESVICVSITLSTVRKRPQDDLASLIAVIEDVTERRAAEERVRFQARLLDATEQAVIATDVQGRITYWNRFAETLYGWTAEEALGRSVVEITCASVTTARAAEIMEKLSRGESWSGEFPVRNRSGREFPAMVIDSPILAADGSLVGIVGVSFDLTAQRKADEALRASEERYRNVIEGADEIIFTIGPDNSVTSINRAFESVSGWRRQDWIGRDFSPLVHPDDLATVLATFSKVQQEGLKELEARVLTAAGDYRVVQCVVDARRNGRGELLEIFGFARDVTERKQAEVERALLAGELRLLLESTGEGLYAVDARGCCTLVNRAATAMLGYREDELIGRDMHEVVHSRRSNGEPYPRTDCPVHRTISRGLTERVDGEVLWKRDGTAIPVEYASAPVREGALLKGAVVTFRDITQRRLLEAQLERANRVNHLGRLAGTMAHEFNNVLMGIQPFAEVLGRAVGEDVKSQRAVAQIKDAVKRGKSVTDEVLRFTRRSEPVVTAMEVRPWLDRLAEESRAVLTERVEFLLDIETDLVVLGDVNQLHQIFMNMIVNARDSIVGSGHVRLSVRTVPPGSTFPFGVVPDAEKFAHLAVADDGHGMAPEILSQMFEPLFTTKKTGTGLGLALAHQVVKQLNGFIFVESQPGAGTTFHVFLPLGAGVPASALPTADTPRTVPVPIQRVVLVEDDEVVAAGLVTLLEWEGIGVDVATSGGAATDIIARCSPNLVILDVGLPDMEGTAVYREIRNRWPRLPVLFSTGHADFGSLDHLVMDFSGYLSKPYDGAKLLTAMQEIMERGAEEAV